MEPIEWTIVLGIAALFGGGVYAEKKISDSLASGASEAENKVASGVATGIAVISIAAGVALILKAKAKA